MKVGYIGTSKKDQNPELRRRYLLAADCEKLFEEQISSRKAERPELTAALEFVSLRESIDTTPGGKLVFHIFGAVAEFERDLILERTVAGLEAARACGRHGGQVGVGEGVVAGQFTGEHRGSILARLRQTPGAIDGPTPRYTICGLPP